MSISISIVLIFLCLFIEGFFSGSELALVSLNRFLLRNKANSGSKAASKVIKLLKRPSELIVVTLLGTNFSTVTMTTIATILAIKLFGDEKAYIGGLIIIPLTLIIGELIPKKFGQRYSDKVSLIVIYPLLFVRILLYPIVFVMVKYSNFLSYILNLKNTQRNFVASKVELRQVLLDFINSTNYEDEEIKMIDNALDLADIYAEDCMIPLIKIDALSDEALVKDAILLISQKGHSRIPIYSDRIDNIIGIIHSFDILKKENINDKVTSILQDTLYVSLTHPVDELIKLFKVKAKHMAIVVDEYGGSVGVITLEDILEEVVGEIDDEFDETELGVKTLSENMFMVDSEVEVETLNEDYNIVVPEGDYVTLGGYLLDLFERIPVKGEKIEDEKNIYFIAKATKRKIEEVIVRVKE